jgi:hypothetical protein
MDEADLLSFHETFRPDDNQKVPQDTALWVASRGQAVNLT